MAKPTFTFEDYSTPGNTLFDLYQYYLNPTDTATTTAANTGISSIFYPQVSGDGQAGDNIRPLTNTIPQQQMLTPEQKALFGGYNLTEPLVDAADAGTNFDRGLVVAPGINMAEEDDEEYLDAIRRIQPLQQTQGGVNPLLSVLGRVADLPPISFLVNAAQQGKDFLSNLGQRRTELEQAGYSENEINFIMANAKGQEAMDSGLYTQGIQYFDTPSGVKDEFGFNVYGRNYLQPGSASYEKFKDIEGSVPYTSETKMQKEREMRQIIAQAEAKAAEEQKIIQQTQTAEADRQAEITQQIASSSQGIRSAGNRAPQGGGDRGAAASGMGGGSQQATSAGSTSSGRTDGGWGWAKGGIVGVL